MPTLHLPRFALLAVSLLAAASLLAACGDDDDAGADRGGLPEGSDEEYVAALCEAFDEFNAGFITALAGLGPEATGKDVVEAVLPPVQAFRAAATAAPVPDDLVAYQQGVLAAIGETADAAEAGDIEAFEQGNLFEFPPLPGDVAAVAADTAACANVPFRDS